MVMCQYVNTKTLLNCFICLGFRWKCRVKFRNTSFRFQVMVLEEWSWNLHFQSFCFYFPYLLPFPFLYSSLQSVLYFLFNNPFVCFSQYLESIFLQLLLQLSWTMTTPLLQLSASLLSPSFHHQRLHMQTTALSVKLFLKHR